MKHKLITIFCLTTCLVLFFHISAFNQFEATPVEKSKQKIRYQGKTYYIHTVKPGHTLYSICKTYHVTEKDIVSANPGIILNPLSIGLIIKIPQLEAVTSDTSEPAKTDNQSNSNFIYHTVQSKENVFYLHQKYNVPIEQIYKYNPESENGIRIGQIIKIPKKHLYDNNDIQPEVPQEKFVKYTVKQGDTLYRIAETYNVTIEEILNANEELRWGLRAGQIIKIPFATEFLGRTDIIPDSMFLVTSLPGLRKYQCDSIASLKRMRPAIKVALLLPFYADKSLYTDTISLTDTLAGAEKVKPKRLKGRAAAEFYEGMLLALDSLKKTGHSVSLFVYDTEADTNKVKTILKDLDIIEPDLIIGPFAPKNVEIVSLYSFERKIPYVPPLLYNDSNLIRNPFLFKVIPNDLILYNEYIKYLNTLHNENIIFLSRNNLKYKKEAELFKNMLLAQLKLQPNFDSIKFKEIYIDDTLQIHLANALDSISNHIIVFSEYEPDVINALARLHFLLRDYPIKVYGFPAWQKFDNLRIDVVHELQVTLYTPFYIDYTDDNVRAFVQKCRARLHYEPYKTTSTGNGINYSYLGYDMTMYFIQTANMYEKNLCNCIEYYDSKLLLANYCFRRMSSQEGFMNISINFITYQKDYTVTKTQTFKWD